MNIEIGKNYINKTWRFLVPSLRGYGDTFIRKFNPVFKLAVGIHDTITDDSKISDGRNLYILCDKLVNEKQFYEFLEWIKYQEQYVADYCPDSEILKSRKHMIVLRVPEFFNDAYDHFLKGEYSLMYMNSELSTLFSNPERENDYNILIRSPKVINDFAKKVNDEFGTKASPNDFRMAELELPLKKTEEIFNCDKNSESVFFNDKIDKVWQ